MEYAYYLYALYIHIMEYEYYSCALYICIMEYMTSV
jgi:hypothetical protein